MYGQNLVTSQFLDPAGALTVTEVFPTLQGEGPDAGCPAVFVRLTHCNLRCYFCDTQFDHGNRFNLLALSAIVVSKCQQHANGCNLVVITGGEPLLQNIIPLTQQLNRRGIRVSVETAGTVYVPGLEDYFGSNGRWNKIICSPKSPKLNEEIVPLVNSWKYIISPGNAAQDDGLPMMSTQIKDQQQRLFRPPGNHPGHIFVQPLDEGDDAINHQNAVFAAQIAMRFGYRLSLQCHKIVGLQ